MYLYWGYPQERNCAFVDRWFLKLWIFYKLYILHFLAHIHAKDPFGTLHTHTIHIHTDKWTHTDTHGHQFYILYFLCHTYMSKIQIVYLVHHRFTNTHTHRDTCAETHVHRYTQVHICRHTQTHAYFFTYTNAPENVTWNPFKPRLAKIVTLLLQICF